MTSTKRQKGLEDIADETAKKNPIPSIGSILEKREGETPEEIRKRLGIHDRPDYPAPVKVPPPQPEPPQPKKFVLTCWDGDIYLLTGYDSVEEIHDRIMGLDWVRMPNGSQIKASSIAKIQSFDDYSFQNDQKWRHKRGQFLSGKNQDRWWHNVDGYIRDADVKAITGEIEAPKLNSPQAKRLTEGQ